MYLSARQGLGEQAMSYADRESELARAKAELVRLLEDYINTLALDVEALQHALSRTVSKLNRLKALNNKMQAHAVWSGEDLTRLLQTLAEMDRKDSGAR